MPQIAVLLAFLQGIVTFAQSLGIVKVPLEVQYSLGLVLPAITLLGLGIAVFLRRLWGAYALVGYSILDTIMKLKLFGAAGTASFLFLGVYVLGTWNLARASHIAPTLRDMRWRGIIGFSVISWVGSGSVAFVFGFLGLGEQMHTYPLFWLSSLGWVILIFALAGKWAAPWRLEGILICVFLVNLLNVADIAFNVVRGYTLSDSLLGWANTVGSSLGLGLVGLILSRLHSLPSLAPADFSPKRLILVRRDYTFVDVMHDTRQLLAFVALVHIGVGYYLYSGNAFRELAPEDWTGLVLVGGLYLVAAIVRSFWLRFVCLAIWVMDLLYTTLIIEKRPNDMVMVFVGVFFLVLMWCKRSDRLANQPQQLIAPAVGQPLPMPNVLSQPAPLSSEPVREIRCWSCKHFLPVTPENRGTKVRCPKCGTKQALPL